MAHAFSIPGFLDEADLRLAEEALSAAQARIHDAWICWGAMELGHFLRKHPEVGSLSLPANYARFGLGPWLRSEEEAFNLLPYHRAAGLSEPTPAWSGTDLASFEAAYEATAGWEWEPRLKPFLRAGRDRNDGHTLWILLRPEAIIERTLLLAIGRPDLWARMEAGMLLSEAPASPSGATVPRI